MGKSEISKIDELSGYILTHSNFHGLNFLHAFHIKYDWNYYNHDVIC